MKKLLVLVITLFLAHVVKSSPLFAPDSSRSSQSAHLNIVEKEGVRDTIMVPVTNPAPLGIYHNNIFKHRLDSIQKDIPLDYNEYVQSYIDLYLTAARKDDIARVLGLSQYYFPICEKVFHETGIPREMEYLSVVESQLNPYAVSRVGATGLWQFMSNTAKTYDLTMDNYVDDRRDPVQASYAAAAYLKDAYQEFGDWLLAIASYNCGKSNVIRAIQQAGSNNFWAIRQYLPAETRGYVPAYIAVTYLMNYYKLYNIRPQICNFSIRTDTVSVDKMVSLSSISHTLNIDPSLLTILNPAYKLQTVNGSAAAPRKVVLPVETKQEFAASYNALNTGSYAVRPHSTYALFAVIRPVEPEVRPAKLKKKLDEPGNKPVKADVLAAVKLNKEEPAPLTKKVSLTYINYRVQQGDTLPAIANKFNGASVEDIMKENGVKEEDLKPGMMLQISKS